MSQPIRIRYVGHATLRLEVDGASLITDPNFRRRVLHLRRQGDSPAPADRERADAILISHLHLDHTDLRSLRELGEGIPVVAPPGAADFLAGKGFDVTELGVGDSHEIAGVRVTATPAAHDGRRQPIFGHWGSSAGYEIAGSQTIYFAGDTDLFGRMGSLFERLDLALLPVWGWGPSLGAGHLDPGRAAKAVSLLRPRLAIPIHWGTFFPYGLARRYARLLHDPPREFAEEVARVAPEVEVRVLEPGSSTDLAPP